MHGSSRRRWLWWWWWLWYVAAAEQQQQQQQVPSASWDDGGGAGRCEVVDVSLASSWYALPTNMTVRPAATGWALHLALREAAAAADGWEGEAAPAACVRVKQAEGRVLVSLFAGACVSGTIKDYNYLPHDALPPHAWTSFLLGLHGSGLTLTTLAAPATTVSLLADAAALPGEAPQLQVTLAEGVEAAVGCHVSCPLYRLAAAGPRASTKVREWRHRPDRLHFFVRPGPGFQKVHYEVTCSTRRGAHIRRGVDIQPGRGAAAAAAAAGAWQQVEVEQRERTAVVTLNGRLMEAVTLPASCPAADLHVLWTVGDAAFGFDCDPRVDEGQRGHAGGHDHDHSPRPHAMHPGVAAAITLVGVAVLLGAAAGVWFLARGRGGAARQGQHCKPRPPTDHVLQVTPPPQYQPTPPPPPPPSQITTTTSLPPPPPPPRPAFLDIFKPTTWHRTTATTTTTAEEMDSLTSNDSLEHERDDTTEQGENRG